MAYYQRGNRGGGGDKAARLTGLFPTKRRELLTGTIRDENLDGLIEKIKEAKAAGLGLVIFCWENTRGNGDRDPAFNLSAAVERPREARRSGGGGTFDNRGGDDPSPAREPSTPVTRRRITEPAPAKDDPFA